MNLKDITGFKKKINLSKPVLMLVCLSLLFCLLLVTAIGLSRGLLSGTRVYNGIYLDQVHLGGLNREELKTYLATKYEKDISALELNVYHKAYPVKVRFEDLKVQINAESTFDRIYLSGRQGNAATRLIEIFRIRKNKLYLETEITLDDDLFNTLVDDIFEKTYVSPLPPQLIILKDEVCLRSGLSGSKTVRETLKERLLQQIKKLESGIVIVPVEDISPGKIETESFYSRIVQEPKEAEIHLVNGKIQITPEEAGRELDKAAFLSSVAELEGRSGKYITELILPVRFIEPARSSDTINTALFRDSLSSFSTSFPFTTENDMNRATNIQLAVKAIHGTILLPGESFSFNDCVGERTRVKGYQPANIYGAQGIESGVGGGVCQVSTTLYNAVLNANLEVLERNPHLYAVAYVPLGQDAAVSFGTEDFSFKNNTLWPVRIDGAVTPDNQIRFSIYGTKEIPALKVSIIPTILNTLPHSTEYVEDSTLEAGESVIQQSGMDGAVVDTQFVLRGNKGVITSYKLHTSSYRPLTEIIHVAPGNIP